MRYPFSITWSRSRYEGRCMYAFLFDKKSLILVGIALLLAGLLLFGAGLMVGAG